MRRRGVINRGQRPETHRDLEVVGYSTKFENLVWRTDQQNWNPRGFQEFSWVGRKLLKFVVCQLYAVIYGWVLCCVLRNINCVIPILLLNADGNDDEQLSPRINLGPIMKALGSILLLCAITAVWLKVNTLPTTLWDRHHHSFYRWGNWGKGGL